MGPRELRGSSSQYCPTSVQLVSLVGYKHLYVSAYIALTLPGPHLLFAGTDSHLQSLFPTPAQLFLGIPRECLMYIHKQKYKLGSKGYNRNRVS